MLQDMVSRHKGSRIGIFPTELNFVEMGSFYSWINVSCNTLNDLLDQACSRRRRKLKGLFKKI